MLPLQRSWVLSLVPGWGTNIPHAVLCSHKKKKKKERRERFSAFYFSPKGSWKIWQFLWPEAETTGRKCPFEMLWWLLLKSIRTSTHSKIVLKNFQKFGRYTLSNFKTFYKVIKCILIDTGCYLQKDKHIDQQNGRNGWEVDPHKYRQLILD